MLKTKNQAEPNKKLIHWFCYLLDIDWNLFFIKLICLFWFLVGLNIDKTNLTIIDSRST